MKRLLLISSSRTHGTGYLEHCDSAVREHLEQVRHLLFVPFALADYDGYTAQVRQRFRELGISVQGWHQAADARQALAQADAVFVGGGNTFRLLNTLCRRDLLRPLRHRVLEGMPYMGSSAGSNLACPSIMTTNDMPIVQPPTFSALDLIPFQLNPHYLDADPATTHQGETRATRIREFLEENRLPVLGLREGSWLRVTDATWELQGSAGGVLFLPDEPPRECANGPLDIPFD